MLVVAGVPPRLLTLLAVLGLAGVVVAFYLDLVQRYAIDRFAAFLHQDSTSPQWRSTSITSTTQERHWLGWPHGVGLFNGLQTNLGYVPEQHTDFIFTAIGSSWLRRSLLIILLLAFVAFRLFRIGRLAKDRWAGSSASAYSSSSPSVVSRTSG